MQRALSHFELKSLTTGSVFKLGLVSNLSIWLVIGLLCGGAALAGLDIVRWNGAYVHGIGGVFTALLVSGVFSLIGAIIFLFGGLIAKMFDRHWSLGKFDIEVREAEASEAHKESDPA